MTEIFKQIIALLIAEDIPFDITKKDNQWYIYHDDLWDISDVYESKIFAFPRMSNFMELGYWADSYSKNYIIKIQVIEAYSKKQSEG